MSDWTATVVGVSWLNDLLRDYPWLPEVLITVIVAVVGWFVIDNRRQKNRDLRIFDYRVISDLRFFTEHARPEDLKVTYKGMDVTDPRVTRIRFKNTGNQAIEVTDFGEGYEIRRGGAGILDFGVTEHSTPGTELARISELGAGSPEYIKITPKMLNSGDWFTVQLTYDGGADEKITVLGRIKDHTRPTAIYPSDSELAAANNARSSSVVFGGMFGVIGLLNLLTADADARWVGWALLGVAAAFIIGGQLVAWNNRRKLFTRLQAGTQTAEPD